MTLLHLAGALVLVLALAGAGYMAAAAVFLRRAMRGRDAGVSPAPAVTVLKPLRGAHPGLYEDLASFVDQAYAGPLQVVFGVQDPADPAIGVVERLRAARPTADLELVVDGRLHGRNRKVSNLINMAGAARHDLLLLSDSDIAAPRDHLARVTAALAGPGVGAVTCYYRGEGRGGPWSVLAAMGVSYGFLPMVALGVGLGMAHPCMGSTIALRRGTLDRIGGLERVSDELVDDYEIGRAVRALGLKVVLPPLLVSHAATDDSLAGLFGHELRWSVTVRITDPLGHWGSIVTHPAPLALAGLLLLGGAPAGWAVLLLALLARAAVKREVDRAAASPSGPWRLLPLRDLLSFAIFLASLFARAVYWRGDRFGVSSARKSPQPGS